MSPIELPMLPAGADAGTVVAPEPATEHARRFRVEGMDCAACARTVEKTVCALPGVAAAAVSFGTATLTVDGDTPAETIAAAVSRAGYRVRPARRKIAEAAVPWW